MNRFVLLGVLLLAACKTDNITPPAPTSGDVVSPIGDAVNAAAAAGADADAAHAQRDSKLSASLEVIGRQNAAAPESPQKPVIKNEVDLSKRLIGKQPTEKDRADAAERELLMATGKIDEANAKYADAVAKADALTERAAKADQARDEAIRRAGEATEAARAKLEAQQREHEQAMTKLTTAHADEIRRLKKQMNDAVAAKQVLCLNIAGGVLIALFAIAIFFGGIEGVRRCWFLGLLGLLCFGLAQIVGAWWFKWACLLVIAAGIGYALWWFWQHRKDADLKQQVQGKADALNKTLTEIVPVIDSAYEKAEGTAKSALDSLLARLGDAMSDESKKVIHVVRAEAK